MDSDLPELTLFISITAPVHRRRTLLPSPKLHFTLGSRKTPPCFHNLMLTLSPVCVCVFVVCIFLIFRSKKGPDSSHLCGMRRSNYCARRKAVCWFSICISKWRNKVALYSRPVLLPNISLLVHILSDFQTRLGCF